MIGSIVLITGTDTDVGKTIVTAALAAAGRAAGNRRIAVDKPTQTGVRGDELGDVDVVARLAAVDSCTEGVRLLEPMAPRSAAECEGRKLPPVTEHAERIRELARHHDLVLVEGAGGLLVELDDRGATLADLAGLLGSAAATVVVARSGLGTLNHTALTVEALHRRELPMAGVVLGSWPRVPGPIEVDNRHRLSEASSGLLGVVPERAGSLAPQHFRERAGIWFADLAVVNPGERGSAHAPPP